MVPSDKLEDEIMGIVAMMDALRSEAQASSDRFFLSAVSTTL
jgi:hypothetical protein